MSIIVPPELLNIIAKADHATMQKAAANVVQASMPGAARPPRYGSLTGQGRRKTADGFEATMTGQLARGAEYGGRRRKKVAYMTRRGSSSFSVFRRTTQQFLPYNSRGYAITPATRRSMAGIRNRIVEAVVRAVAG